MQTVTLELPETLYRFARQVAEATQKPLETVLRDSIAHALPPVNDLPHEQAVEFAALSALDDATLWRQARAMMSEAEQVEMRELLDSQGAGQLTSAQHARLQGLQDSYGQAMVRKAHAYLLLARRGYRVPMQGDSE